jgi:hypothetical protein
VPCITAPHQYLKQVKGFPMSLFSKILEKLGLRKEKEDEQPVAAGTSGTAGSMPRKPSATSPNLKTTTAGKATGRASAPAPAARRPMSEVDVVKMLEQKAKGTGLNWKQSISDLLFLLEIDNSREARTELAKELGAPADVMSDSARMNTWLHKTVLRKIADNGGNIPRELLD